MRRAGTIVLALVALLFLASCGSVRDFLREWMHAAPADAEKGAGVGFAIGGPQGAIIGSVAMLITGGVIRALEKRQLRRSGVLTDKRARQEAITARTARPPPPPQSLFPTDSTLGD